MAKKPEVSTAAIYVRVSTEEQGEQNLSIPFQVKTCERFIKEREWSVGDIYKDVASGKTDRREEFQRLIADAQQGGFQAVVIYKYSRFARNDLDSQIHEMKLAEQGVILVSATEPVDSTTSSGWLMKRVMQLFAEYDNRVKADFVRAGMRQKVEQGGWPWRAPLGYLNHRGYIEGRRRRTWVELDPERAPLVRRCFELAATGDFTLRQICEQMTDAGFRTREGKRLLPKKLVDMLRNEFYIGIVASPTFEVHVKGVHEPLISEDLFQRVQVALAVRGRGPKRPKRRDRLFQGVIYCACGCRINITGPYSGGQSYLRCMSYVNRTLEGCRGLGPRLDELLRQFEEKVLPSLYVSTDDVDQVREELLALSEVEGQQAE
ncbi:MAG: recombinase family protein, partial [Chloroflexi bacterium]|nr:recombinase family protein [Chloroflexota bacterium]